MNEKIKEAQQSCTLFGHTTEGELSYSYTDTSSDSEQYTTSSTEQPVGSVWEGGVNILGTHYRILVRTPEQDELLKKWDGYCDWTIRTIVLNSCADREDVGSIFNYCKHVATHEAVHAAMHESGMKDYSGDEILVEWVACMLDKITDIADDIARQVKPHLSYKGERGCEQ